MDTVFTAYPFHLVGCFERFSDTLGCRHLFGKLSEHLVGGMVNLTLMRVQLAGLEQILIQAAFILTKIASMAQIIDTDWFQLWFFITGDEIIIFKQLVSKCCAFICYEFFIVTTSALYRDSMIAEIIKIYENTKPC